MENKEINEGIVYALENYGVKYDGKYIMSLWQLSDDLNNSWYSKFFYRKGYMPKGAKKYFSDWAFPDFNLRPLRLRVLRYLESLSWAKKFGECKYGDYFQFDIDKFNEGI